MNTVGVWGVNFTSFCWQAAASGLPPEPVMPTSPLWWAPPVPVPVEPPVEPPEPVTVVAPVPVLPPLPAAVE
ncbi:MAG TPA: hypothetical protein VHO67_15475 [Polyangia bacterium]|nr:hypothetical protein [Polyangia bacterium]